MKEVVSMATMWQIWVWKYESQDIQIFSVYIVFEYEYPLSIFFIFVVNI